MVICRRSATLLESRALTRALFKLTIITLAKSPITETTTRSSINVNPECCRGMRVKPVKFLILNFFDIFLCDPAAHAVRHDDLVPAIFFLYKFKLIAWGDAANERSR